MKKGFFERSYSLELKLKKLFFISARKAIAESLEKKGIEVEQGFVNWYAGHIYEASKETLLKLDEALKKWEGIKRMRRRKD